jgi:hypothetical protein
MWSHKNFAVFFVYLINSYGLSLSPAVRSVKPGSKVRETRIVLDGLRPAAARKADLGEV